MSTEHKLLVNSGTSAQLYAYSLPILEEYVINTSFSLVSTELIADELKLEYKVMFFSKIKGFSSKLVKIDEFSTAFRVFVENYTSQSLKRS